MTKYREKLLTDINVVVSEPNLDSFDWASISRANLTEEFVIEFQEKLNWLVISRKQNLSEEFIRKFEKKIDWFAISMYQQLSDTFLLEFEHKIYWLNYFNCNDFSITIIKKMIFKKSCKKLLVFKKSHLTVFQIAEIQKLLTLKKIFK